MPKEDKSTSLEKERRIDAVCEMLVKGLSRQQMLKYVQTKRRIQCLQCLCNYRYLTSFNVIKD